jgi:hypothetical protein
MWRKWIASGRPMITVAVCCLGFSGCGSDDHVSQAPVPRWMVDDEDDAPPPVKTSTPNIARSQAAAPERPKNDPLPSPAPEASVRTLSEEELRKGTINRLRELSKALESYKGNNDGDYPNQVIQRLSWRVWMLPYLGRRDLFSKFRLTEPWDSQHNLKLVKEIPHQYQPGTRSDGKTNFLLVTGAGTAYDRASGRGEHEFPDGADNTVLLAEVGDHLAVPWTKPEDYVFRRSEAQRDLFGLRKDCCFLVMGGAMGVRRLPANIADAHLLALLSPGGGESTLAKDHTAYPYPEVDLKLIAELERNPLKRFAEVTTAKAAGTKSLPSAQSGAPGTSSPVASKVEPPVPADPRLPVPDDKALAAATAILKELYKEDYKTAKKREEKRSFAKKLLEQANRVKIGVDPAGTFVLLREARDIGAQGGDIDTALAATDKLGKTFQVDPLPMKLKALEQAAPALDSEAEDEKLFKKSMELETELLAVDDFDGAKRALTLAATGARRCGKRELAAQVAPRKDELEEVKRAFDRVAGAMRRLVLSPDDPAASGAVGRYLCLVKQNWPRGLVLLARGDDQRFRELAAADLSNPTLAEARAAIGDRWWELSEQQSAGKSGSETAAAGLDKLSSVERHSARVRAAYWYRQALPGLPASLTSERAKQRIAETIKKKDEQHAKQAGATAKARSKNAR